MVSKFGKYNHGYGYFSILEWLYISCIASLDDEESCKIAGIFYQIQSPNEMDTNQLRLGVTLLYLDTLKNLDVCEEGKKSSSQRVAEAGLKRFAEEMLSVSTEEMQRVSKRARVTS